ncbi:MAG: hypothetical protein LBU60_06625 [Clostridiales bacterium]|jgi:hypothetical protein|nr:hypothetical protein [Clostridiales bacterium]
MSHQSLKIKLQFFLHISFIFLMSIIFVTAIKDSFLAVDSNSKVYFDTRFTKSNDLREDKTVEILLNEKISVDITVNSKLTLTSSQNIIDAFPALWWENVDGDRVHAGESFLPPTNVLGNLLYSLWGGPELDLFPTKIGEVFVNVIEGDSLPPPTDSPIRFEKQPVATQTLSLYSVFTLSVQAVGAQNITYQWVVNNTNSSTNGSAIPNQTGNTMTVPTNKDGTFYYYVVARIGEDTSTAVSSSVSQITITTSKDSSINITSQPVSNLNVDLRGEISLKVNADGSGLKYQWFKNEYEDNAYGQALHGQTKNKLSIKAGESGDFYYYCVITNSGASQSVTTTLTSVRVSTNIAKGGLFDLKTIIWLAVGLAIACGGAYGFFVLLKRRKSKVEFVGQGMDEFDSSNQVEIVSDNNYNLASYQNSQNTYQNYQANYQQNLHNYHGGNQNNINSLSREHLRQNTNYRPSRPNPNNLTNGQYQNNGMQNGSGFNYQGRNYGGSYDDADNPYGRQ